MPAVQIGGRGGPVSIPEDELEQWIFGEAPSHEKTSHGPALPSLKTERQPPDNPATR
jgi:hypothetical protein